MRRNRHYKGKTADGKKTKKIIVGASAVPHAEILEAAKPLLAKKGIDLEVKVFQDYVFTKRCIKGKKRN
ncbi:hypothetical protein GCM10020331_028600 [Ectobacillus funiculus]